MNTVDQKANRLIGGILFLSLAVLIFLFWWIYGKPVASAEGKAWVAFLPSLNAGLNTASALAACLGVWMIKHKRVTLHAALMSVAGLLSAAFLVSYLLYHHFQGDTPFQGQGMIRPIYFFILITHILGSILIVPGLFLTYAFAFTQRFSRHKKLARIVFPLWIYVSVTGVLVYILLHRMEF